VSSVRGGDAVGHAEVSVPAADAVRRLPVGDVAGPPARCALPGFIVCGNWFGELHQVGQHAANQVAVRVTAQQVRAEPGQAAHQVELGQRSQSSHGHRMKVIALVRPDADRRSPRGCIRSLPGMLQLGVITGRQSR
jgi:hypothetical protein